MSDSAIIPQSFPELEALKKKKPKDGDYDALRRHCLDAVQVAGECMYTAQTFDKKLLAGAIEIPDAEAIHGKVKACFNYGLDIFMEALGKLLPGERPGESGLFCQQIIGNTDGQYLNIIMREGLGGLFKNREEFFEALMNRLIDAGEMFAERNSLDAQTEAIFCVNTALKNMVEHDDWFRYEKIPKARHCC